MPYLVGSCPLEDCRWQQFLADPNLSNADRSKLLLSISVDDRALYDSPFTGLDSAVFQPPASRVAVSPAVNMSGPKSWQLALANRSVFIVHRGEAAYSALLNNCPDAPPVLFCQGDITLLQRPAIAVVGSRRPSRDGSAAAFELGAQLAGYGLVVVSGLARGIDGHAHAGALSAGGATVAVMATGLDRIYPDVHKRLAADIVGNGLLITEFPPYVNPERWHFPRRNRTLSGLCLATVVVEAGRPSGSLLTATAAAEQGREVFAYPWSIYHKGGEGCRYLLGDGAHLAQSADDVVLGLAPLSPDNAHRSAQCAPDASAHEKKSRPRKSDSLTNAPPTFHCSPATSPEPSSKRDPLGGNLPEEMVAQIIDLIGDAALDLPLLCQLTGRDASELAVALAHLEIAGALVSTPLGYRLKRTQLCDYPC